MTIDEAKDSWELETRKYQFGVFSGDEFSLTFNNAQRQLVAYLCGQIQDYQFGRPIARVSFEINKSVASILSPCVVNNTSIAITAGVITEPADYYMLSDMRDVNDLPIRWADYQRLANYLRSVVNPIASYPRYTEGNGTWNVYGVTGTAKIDYIRIPPDVKWGHIDTSGREVYDPSTSTDPVWDDVTIVDEIFGRMLKLAGVSLRDPVLMNYGESTIKTGE